MRLRHATPARNTVSIRTRGLLCSKSRGQRAVIWLHTAGRSDWAVLHTMRRHGGKDVTVIEVSIPRSWLTRSRAGLWYSGRDVPASRITRNSAVEDE